MVVNSSLPHNNYDKNHKRHHHSWDGNHKRQIRARRGLLLCWLVWFVGYNQNSLIHCKKLISQVRDRWRVACDIELICLFILSEVLNSAVLLATWDAAIVEFQSNCALSPSQILYVQLNHILRKNLVDCYVKLRVHVVDGLFQPNVVLLQNFDQDCFGCYEKLLRFVIFCA